MADGEHSVQTHYRSAGLLDRILAGLKEAGNIPPAGAAPPLGMHLVLGERHAEKRANSSRALRDGRISYIQGVFAKQ